MNWQTDDLATIDGTGGNWRVLTVNDSGDITVEHEPTGGVDTVPAGWLQPATEA